MALISLLFLLSARAFCKDITAHKAAGNQPSRVSCNNKQIIAVKILPLKKKDRKGKRMANNISLVG